MGSLNDNPRFISNSLSERHIKRVSPIALPSDTNSNTENIISPNITANSPEKYLDFDKSGVLKALEYIKKSIANKEIKELDIPEFESIPIDDITKLTNPKLPNVSKGIEDFISDIMSGKGCENIVLSECRSPFHSDYSKQQSMDLDRIVSPVRDQESSCSDNWVEIDSSSSKDSLFISPKKTNSSKSKASDLCANMQPVLPPSEISAKINIEKTEQSSRDGTLSGNIRVKSVDSGSRGKRKITHEEYFPRSKIPRIHNSSKRKLNSEYQSLNRTEPSTIAKDPSRADSSHVLPDHRMRRSTVRSTTSNAELDFTPTSASSGHVQSKVLNTGITNLTSSANTLEYEAPKCLISFPTPVAHATELNRATSTKIKDHKKHSFASPQCTARTISPSHAPFPESTCLANSDKNSHALLTDSQSEKIIHDNKATSKSGDVEKTVSIQDACDSAHHITGASSHRVEDFPQHRGNVDYWRKSIGKRIMSTSYVIHVLLEWNFHWLDIQMETKNCPPICTKYKEISDIYDYFGDYYNTYFPLHMLKIWLKMYTAWNDCSYPVHYVTLDRCDEKYYVEVSVTLTNNSSGVKHCFKRKDIVCIKFIRNGMEDVLFGYIYKVVGIRRKSKISFYTAEKLFIPLGTNIKILKLCNLRVLLKQHDAMRSLKVSPFKRVILDPIDHQSEIYVITLPFNLLEMSYFIRTVADLTYARNRITLVDARPSIDRISFISKLVKHLLERKSKVLVCLKDRQTLFELAKEILNYVEDSRFVLALKSSEIKVPYFLAHHILHKRIKMADKKPRGRKATLSFAQNLEDSDVILTMLNNIYFKGKVSFAKSNLKCIIDDASLCTETETILPLYYNVEHLVLIGDAQKETLLHPNLQKYGYNKSLYTRLYKAKKIL